LDIKFKEAMESITKFFKVENDPFFREGEAKGREEGKRKEVENLIVKLGLSDEQVAEVAEVSVDFVKKVRAIGSRQ
jgi:predicted transposase YdaD